MMPNKLPQLVDGQIQITGCKDCPFCEFQDMSGGYKCQAERALSMTYDEYMRYDKRILDDQKTFIPITPEWCPLKTQSITISY